MWNALATLLERPLAVPGAAFARRDAIVVLGAALWRGDRLSPVLAERVAAAAALWHAGGGRVVAATGGVTRTSVRAEAEVMADALAAAGVPDVIVEREARTTAQNATNVARLLAPLGVRSAWIVTQPFHARRAQRLFRAAGLDARAWHIADSLEYVDRKRAVKWLVREYAAWARLAVSRAR